MKPTPLVAVVDEAHVFMLPLDKLAEIYMCPIKKLAAELRCPRSEALSLQIAAAAEAAPYFHKKQPIAEAIASNAPSKKSRGLATPGL